MPDYYSPEGNFEVWEEKPDGYYTAEEWEALHPPKPPTIEETTQKFIDLIQLRLDRFAQTRGYDGILSACSYAVSTATEFQSEGVFCVEKRDATWLTAYAILNDVTSGARPMPTWAEVEAELPDLEWPSVPVDEPTNDGGDA